MPPNNSTPPSSAAQSTSRKSPLGYMIAALLIVMALVAGYVIGVSKGEKAGYAKGATEAVESAKQRYAETSTRNRPEPTELHTLSGQVTTVGSAGFTISVPQTVNDPFAEPAPLSREVRVTSETTIVMRTLKDPETFRAEMDAFQAERAAAFNAGVEGDEPTSPPPQPPAPPSRYIETKMALADLKTGMSVDVSSAADILRATSFDATHVGVQAALPGDNEPASPDAGAEAGADVSAPATEPVDVPVAP